MTKKLHYATWGLIVFQVIFWTFVPLFAHHAPPLDVSEMHGWAQTFQWGFYKHPPMPTWIIAASQFLVGKNMLSLLPATIPLGSANLRNTNLGKNSHLYASLVGVLVRFSLVFDLSRV